MDVVRYSAQAPVCTMTVGAGLMSLLKYAVTAFACGSKPDHGETRPAPERVSMLSPG